MFKNYLKIAWRNLVRNKAYSAINIGGITIGWRTLRAAAANPADSLRSE